jgi:hypothetical protein
MERASLPAVLMSLAIGGFLVGCGGDDTESPVANGNGRTANGNGDHRPGPVEIDPASIQVTDWAGVQELVARHKGKVVVVYLWATFNQPAVNELPQIARLCRDHASDLHCVSVSMDYSGEGVEPDELREDVAEELGQAGAEFDHVISSTPAEALYEEIDMLSGIPAVYVYNRDGELARRFDNEDPDQPEFSFRKDVVPFVEELLGGE